MVQKVKWPHCREFEAGLHSKWVPFSNWGMARQRKERELEAFQCAHCDTVGL